MQEMKESPMLIENESLFSIQLQREVIVDLYYPPDRFDSSPVNLLLINDGQDMQTLGLKKILETLYDKEMIRPLLIVAMHAGAERKMEYGIANMPDYKGRGAKAAKYSDFVMNELLPYIITKSGIKLFSGFGFAGFSLGGLSALDIAWNHPEVFNRVGVFSGSLWWRSVDQLDEEYSD
ncbi:MAG TPA: alpha/beta hydrolase-fold protein, partial [Chitinophagaceae bacterium]|nr:alpha/beta hydrolase-fold protein [Chitinophagaceae bacterium]